MGNNVCAYRIKVRSCIYIERRNSKETGEHDETDNSEAQSMLMNEHNNRPNGNVVVTVEGNVVSSSTSTYEKQFSRMTVTSTGDEDDLIPIIHEESENEENAIEDGKDETQNVVQPVVEEEVHACTNGSLFEVVAQAHTAAARSNNTTRKKKRFRMKLFDDDSSSSSSSDDSDDVEERDVRFKRHKTVTSEKVLRKHNAKDNVEDAIKEAGLDDIQLRVKEGPTRSIASLTPKHIAQYCLPLFVLHFQGQVNHIEGKDADEERKGEKKMCNMNNYLKLMDQFIRQYDDVKNFTGQEEEYKLILRFLANKRYIRNEETVHDCYRRLRKESKRFVRIYHKRGRKSDELPSSAKRYWGTRQQLLAGKVIGDWVDRENGPLDPVFGVMLNPTAGRAGRGEGGVIHKAVFDDMGPFAYHSAVHDAFGYLMTAHEIGPGYDYMDKSRLKTTSPLSGQIDGVKFWRNLIAQVKAKQSENLDHDLEHFRC